MSDEASKTRAVRRRDFAEIYLNGRVIDIGCGPDLVVSHAEPFDLEHGNAEDIAGIREIGGYDAVCSSHCLEHMRNVPKALEQWWALVRERGYLIVVVPEEDLYEQGGWPSLFNEDHKATFTLGRPTTWSPVSYDIVELFKNLRGAEIISCELQDQSYDHSLKINSISPLGRILFKFNLRCQAVFRQLLRENNNVAERIVSRAFRRLGMPIDQTAGPALAQIQIIARKRSS
jgi:SAM-dependent methyltransferase